MKLVFVFLTIFFGSILLVVGTGAFFKAAGRFMDFVSLKTGRPATQVGWYFYVVFMALVCAVFGTIAVATG